MIAFASLFLSLAFGVVTVDLAVAKGVDSVQLLRDGRTVATMRGSWSARVDLGPLAPHELVAVALDAGGREVGRARQWVNRPRSLAEASFVLEPDGGAEKGRGRIARLAFRNALAEKPLSISVTFDGVPIPSPDPSRIEIPPHDPERFHFLRARVDFGGDLEAVADATFGGTRKAEAVTELTAVPVSFAGRIPPPEELEGAFARGGVPLRVVAVEEGPAEVLLVLAGNAGEHLRALLAGEEGTGRRSTRGGRGPWSGTLGRETTVRVVWPVPEARVQPRGTVRLFPASKAVPAGTPGFLSRALAEEHEERVDRQQVGAATAAAGVLAAAKDRRRAVVLLFGSEAGETGLLPAEDARRYLETLGVPLRAWALAGGPPPLAARFGRVEDASTPSRLAAAFRELGRTLALQRIAWVEGAFPPHEVDTTSRAAGVTLAR